MNAANVIAVSFCILTILAALYVMKRTDFSQVSLVQTIGPAQLVPQKTALFAQKMFVRCALPQIFYTIIQAVCRVAWNKVGSTSKTRRIRLLGANFVQRIIVQSVPLICAFPVSKAIIYLKTTPAKLRASSIKVTTS